MKIESTIIDVFNSKNRNICCCGSEKCALSHGVGVSQGPVHDCMHYNNMHYENFDCIGFTTSVFLYTLSTLTPCSKAPHWRTLASGCGVGICMVRYEYDEYCDDLRRKG